MADTEPGQAGGTGHRGAVLLRVAALSVAEMSRLLRRSGEVSDTMVRSAVTCAAGPGLMAAAEGSASAGERARAQEAVRRYIARMGGRATPYGLLAGTCVSELGERTTLRLAGRAGYRVSASLDVAVLERLVAGHVRSASRWRVPLRVNPTLVRLGEYFSLRTEQAPLDVVRVRSSAAISLVLACCERSRTGEDLARQLRGQPGVPDDGSAETFVSGLMDHGLLSPDTGLLCPGRSPAHVAAGLLDATGGDKLGDKLTRIASQLEPWQPLTPEFLARLDQSWDDLRTESSELHTIRPGSRYDLHLGVTCSGTLDRKLVRDLGRAADRLAALFPPSDRLAELRARFEARYGDATVPVLEVADPENGLLPWPARWRSGVADRAQARTEPPPRRREAGQIQLAALDHWLSTGSPFDLATVQLPDREAPGQLRARGVLAALVRDAPDGCHSVLAAAGLAGAGALFGRLAASDPVLAGQMRAEIADPGHGPGGIAAEVMYSPGGRVGNVLVRPRVCGESIALAGATGGTIHPGRLLMRAEDGGFAVYDEQTGARVTLYVNSAYRAWLAVNDPLYTLLATLAGSNLGVTWQWQVLRDLRHLPRVVCGRVIVSPERWLVSGESLLGCAGSGDPGSALRSCLPGIGTRRWVGGREGEGDHLLPVDLRSQDQLPGILRYLARRGITEFAELPHVEHPYVRGPRGYHVAEICASFGRPAAGRPAVGRPAVGRPAAGRPAAGRPVGKHPAAGRPAGRDSRTLSRPAARDEWSYVQLFCGVSAADSVVTRAHALASALRAGGIARQWFFVRYEDGGYHVRVRISASRERARREVTGALHELALTLTGEGLVTFMRQEPYIPEVRRYGGPEAMLAAEDLFCADSDRVAGHLASRPGELARLAVASRVIGSWWRRATGTREDLYPVMREAQRVLWPGGRLPAKGAGRVWRAYRAEVESEIRSAAAPVHGEPELDALLGRVRRDQLREVIASVVHMHCNRLFACDNRRMEALAYEFALREMMRSDARPA